MRVEAQTIVRAAAALSIAALVDADAAVLHAKMHAAVFAVLTPEQQQKAKELRGTMENRMKGGRERIRQHMEQRFEPRTEQSPSEPETV